MNERKQEKLIVTKAAFIFKRKKSSSMEFAKSDPTGSSVYTIPTVSVTCTKSR